MPRVNVVQKARKPIPSAGVGIGDKYFWWKFRYGGKRVSKTYPKRSELTNSGFLQSLYELEDNLSFDREDLQDEWISDLEGVDLDVDEELTEEEKESRLDDIVSELEGCSSGL